MSADSHEHHITPLPTYIAIYCTLLVLTVVTVAVSYLGLPTTPSLILAMCIATVKATLVGAWFMHLKYDTKFNIFIFLAAFWFGGSFFLFTFIDLSSRGDILKIQNVHELRAESAEGL